MNKLQVNINTNKFQEKLVAIDELREMKTQNNETTIYNIGNTFGEHWAKGWQQANGVPQHSIMKAFKSLTAFYVGATLFVVFCRAQGYCVHHPATL